MRYLFIFILVSLSYSCSIQKRVHNKGYFITWNSNYSGSEKKLSSTHTVETKKTVSDSIQEFEAETSNLEDQTVQIENRKFEDKTSVESTNLQIEEKSTNNLQKQKIGKRTFSHRKTLIEKEPQKKKRIPIHITGINFFDWILEFLIWVLAIVCGIISAVFVATYFFISNGDSNLDYTKKHSEGEKKKTFGSVFRKVFRVVCVFFTVLFLILILLGLVYYVYVQLGLLALILIIVLAIILVVLLTVAASKMMPFLFIGWGK